MLSMTMSVGVELPHCELWYEGRSWESLVRLEDIVHNHVGGLDVLELYNDA